VRAEIILAALIPLLFIVANNAYATQFYFNTSSGKPSSQLNFGLPAIMIALASVVGALLIIKERKKARGIWFSNNERLK
jgi:hypothetical protein